MRLLHAQTLEFKEFIGSKIPPYAIISHRWTEEEVSYKDYLDHRAAFLAGEMHGYGWLKIFQAAPLTLLSGKEWFWIDTCCIDKTSSAELTEAINSMFNWYRRSEECYVFFSDVFNPQKANIAEESDPTKLDFPLRREQWGPYDQDQFRSSEWFTRAWTLQELLAPGEVYFFDASFTCFGSRRSHAEIVSEITGIPLRYLNTDSSIEASVAEKMPWASHRHATREEDLSYSLLGLFEVNMPLLYGEEGKAFQRLQTEIIKNSPDESIFAWSYQTGYYSGLLARSLKSFTKPYHEQPREIERRFRMPRQHYEMTNRGVRILLPFSKADLQKLEKAVQEREFQNITVLIQLNCSRGTLSTTENFDIYLEAIIHHDDNLYYRQQYLRGVRRTLHYLLHNKGSKRSLLDWRALGTPADAVLDGESDTNMLTPVYFCVHFPSAH